MKQLRYSFNTVVAATLILICWSCASIGNPTGGPRDEDPPRFVRSNPPMGATGVTRTRISLEFDELVNVKDAFTNVVISPTSAEMPRVQASGRRININFPDTLQANTTYTIDFGNSIEDNNEANVLQGFSYTFSTGPVIDSLRISGIVLAARDLEPQQGIMVGVHSQQGDSVFMKERFERVARTDDRGRFTVRGLKPGRYRIFALKDLNNDYRWDNPEEDIAFVSDWIVPYAEPAEAADTVYDLKTGEIDTIVSRTRTRFLPNDVLLSTFNIDRRQQYLKDYVRTDSTRLYLSFGAPSAVLPEIRIIEPSLPGTKLLLERNEKRDSLVYWLPAELLGTDTVKVEVRYLKNDKSYNLVAQTDTLDFIARRPKPVKQKKKKGEEEKPEQRFADMNIRPSQEIYGDIRLEFGAPLARIDTAAFHLWQKTDTVWNPAPGKLRLEADSLSPLKYKLKYPWEYGGDYRIEADTLAVTDIYGLISRPAKQEFKIKAKEEYCNLSFAITQIPDSVAAVVELLSSSDSPVRIGYMKPGQTTVDFTDVAPGTYYARLYLDANGNGEYDTGDYEGGLQPEEVYYLPKKVVARKNWDLEYGWDIYATALDLQKPLQIKKNKPAADKKSRTSKEGAAEEEEDDFFDPTANPFDPNQKRERQRRRAASQGLSY